MSWHWWDDEDPRNPEMTKAWFEDGYVLRRKIEVEYEPTLRCVYLAVEPTLCWSVADEVDPEDSETVIQLTKLRYNLCAGIGGTTWMQITRSTQENGSLKGKPQARSLVLTITRAVSM